MNINATLIGESITFFIFVWFCMKYVWPPIMNSLNERKKLIADGLAAGERGRNELELASKSASQHLLEAKQKSGEIVAAADKRAAQIIDEAKQAAKVEADRIFAGAQANVAQEVVRAREALRSQVAELAVAGAEKILRREINSATHADLLTAIQNEL
jgi:F-type H+-transporting ATPase subunit b